MFNASFHKKWAVIDAATIPTLPPSSFLNMDSAKQEGAPNEPDKQVSLYTTGNLFPFANLETSSTVKPCQPSIPPCPEYMT